MTTSDPPIHPDLVSEQAVLDRAHRFLENMQDRARAAKTIGDRVVQDEDSADARVVQYHLERRQESLHSGHGPLCFGRIDNDSGERWYVGRRHVEDDQARPVVVDWRAPVSAAFYRATAVDPCGLEFRRRFSIADQEIVSIFDEDLTDPDANLASGLPDPLLAELDRARSGQMSDIIATIAAEQDVIIRAPLDELLVVQGGPGTGKTAVGLHRAAFLLFQHRQDLSDSKVLVLGPNPLFLRYIADVLPSLGEVSVRQATVEGLLAAKYRVAGVDEPAVARVKGDLRMAAVVDGAIRNRIRIPADGLEVKSGLAVVRFLAEDLEAMVKTVLSRRLPINDGREVLRNMLVAEAWRRHSGRASVDPGSEPIFTSGARGDKSFRSTVDKLWPKHTAVAVLKGLFSSRKRLAEASAGILDDAERQLLYRPSAKKGADEPWTVADLAILDEIETRCVGVPTTYGHVVVDEAQDLSPMALRLVGRRAERGSMTILGDLAQATTPMASRSWETAIETLVAAGQWVDDPPAVHVTELTVGYRVPAAILDVANRLLAEAAPTVTPARSVRPGGDPPLIVAVEADELAATVVAEVTALQERTTSVAVVAVGGLLDRLEPVFTEAEIQVERVDGSNRRGGGLPGADAVALVEPASVKGLEFDAVVVVEPAAIAELDAGLRHLYVSLTRAVQHLGIVHHRPLPAALS